MTVYIKHSKVNQMRQGDKVVIARTAIGTCPVAMLEAYITNGDVKLNSSQKLFRTIVNGKVDKLRDTGGLSHSRMSELVKEKLGFKAVEFGLHSLQSGGTTTAARAGVPDRLFKRH